MRPNLERLKQETATINAEFRQRTVGFIVGGLSLVAGLAWNDAIRSLIEYFIPLGRGGILVKFIYAFLISLVVVVFSVYLARLFSRDQVKKDDSE